MPLFDGYHAFFKGNPNMVAPVIVNGAEGTIVPSSTFQADKRKTKDLTKEDEWDESDTDNEEQTEPDIKPSFKLMTASQDGAARRSKNQPQNQADKIFKQIEKLEASALEKERLRHESHERVLADATAKMALTEQAKEKTRQMELQQSTIKMLIENGQAHLIAHVCGFASPTMHQPTATSLPSPPALPPADAATPDVPVPVRHRDNYNRRHKPLVVY